MNIALVDDDAEALRLLSSLFEAQLTQMFDAIHRIDTYPSGEAFLQAWTAGAYDLIVLDIYMERRNGIAVAEQIRQTDQSVQIAFCTSSNEFAAETYAVNARDYLQKPITAEKVARLLHKLDAAQIEQSRSVLLPDGAALRCRSVIYAEYSNHRMRFHMKTGKHHTVYASFAEIQKLLKSGEVDFTIGQDLAYQPYQALSVLFEALMGQRPDRDTYVTACPILNSESI